jgi:hypothetical protein
MKRLKNGLFWLGRKSASRDWPRINRCLSTSHPSHKIGGLVARTFTLKNDSYLKVCKSMVFDIDLLFNNIENLRNALNLNNDFTQYITLENAKQLDTHIHQLMQLLLANWIVKAAFLF